MSGRSRFSLLLVAGCLVGLSACSGDNYVVIPRDGGVGAAVSAARNDGQVGEELDAGVGGSAGAGGGPDALDAPDAAGMPTAIPCTASAECLDADPCNGIESCDNGFCLQGMPIPCNDGNACTTDLCDGSTGACLFNLVANFVPCGAVDKCDGQVCLEGFCTPGPAPVCAGTANVCARRSCDPATGACVESHVPDGSACDDATVCNGREVCQQGVCRPGTGLACADTSVCTVDRCDPVAGCVSTPVGDGTSCADANLCNGNETCTGGVCRPGNAATCEDFNPCTTDVCNPLTGACRAEPLPNGVACPDGNLCDGQKCQEGVCVAGTPVVCARDNDNNPCTATVCVPETGTCIGAPVANGTPCPDGDLCDGTETCQSGVCAVPGTPLSCPDDGNPCTTDLCAPAAGCLHLNVPDGTTCADADGCDGTETCTAGRCSATGVLVTCNDANPCTSDVCVSVPSSIVGQPPIGTCTALPLGDGASCSDGNACNGSELCGSGICLAGAPKNCDDNNPCTTDSCNSANGACTATPLDDGIVCGQTDPCAGTQTCSSGICVQAPPVSCVPPAVCVSETGQCQ